MTARKGRQTPTISVIQPYEKTRGQEASELYSKSGNNVLPWQELVLDDMMAVDDNGLWKHQKYGFSVPRRNGKNEVVIMREAWALVNGERVCHTAHRTTTSTSAFNRLVRILKFLGYDERIRIKTEDLTENEFKSTNQKGQQRIELANGATADFRTRTGSGGLGEGFDLLVVDEAQEYTTEQETALNYTVSDSKNPQTVFCGTPPTMVSAGTVFQTLRTDCINHTAYASGWAEWSVSEEPKTIDDVDLWYETNPSLGYHLKERVIRSEMGSDEDKILDFKIQRLGFWFEYSLTSAINKNEWQSLKYKDLKRLRNHLTGALFVGIKYNQDSVSLSVAVKMDDENIFIEAIDCRPVRAGNNWIIDFLRLIKTKHVVVDGKGNSEILANEMKDNKLKQPLIPTVNDVIVANAMFEKGIADGIIRHADQPSLTQSVTNCTKRNIGNNGGFGYKTNNDAISVSLIESVVLAFWLRATTKDKKKIRISY